MTFDIATIGKHLSSSYTDLDFFSYCIIVIHVIDFFYFVLRINLTQWATFIVYSTHKTH